MNTHETKFQASRKVEIQGERSGLFVIVDGVKIAKRGRPGTPYAKTWVVRDFDEGWRSGIEIEHHDVRVH
jgi:hypothetical protein